MLGSRCALLSLITLLSVAACGTKVIEAAPAAAPDIGDAGVVNVEDDASAPAIPDPTGFRAAGALHTARAQATATRMADGRVLIVGGDDSKYGMIASVEIFDPKTDTFTDAAPLPEPRVYHSATLLKTGEVLVAGGGPGSEISLPTGDSILSSALLYDPVTNSWKETGAMHGARAGHRATLLDDGRVLVVGGGDSVGYTCASIHPNCTIAKSIGTTEIYDPSSGTWTPTGSLSQPRIAFSLNVLPSGIIVVAGGAADNQGLTSVEIFDPPSGVWRKGPDLIGQRLYHSTAVLNGTLVVAGGKLANVAPLTSVDVLDTAAATSWKSGTSLKEARTGASFVPLPSGRGLLVAGNDQLGTQFLPDAAIYDAAADTWTPIAPLTTGRYSQVAAALDDGSVLVVGGRGPLGVVTASERSR